VVGKNGRPLAAVFPTQQKPVAVTHFITSSNGKRYMPYFPKHRTVDTGAVAGGGGEVSGVRVQREAKYVKYTYLSNCKKRFYAFVKSYIIAPNERKFNQ
jgi:hypothetical protein